VILSYHRFFICPIGETVEQLKEKYAEWGSFTSTREAERARVMNPESTKGLKQEIKDQQALVLQEQAKLQMLKAQLTLSGAAGETYRKAAFDLEWSQKKTDLKTEVETLIAEQIEAGVSIPKLMKELQCKSPNWLYSIRENLNLYRGAAKEETLDAHWEWSDATSVHRYGIAKAPENNEWAFVLMIGAIDSEFDGERCVFDFKTGNYISGSKALFDSVGDTVRKQRAKILAQIIDGTYTKSLRRDTNPYFETK
jgi:hypothetical protein